MQIRGTKWIDPHTQHQQLDWLMVSADDCPDSVMESILIRMYFRVAHEPWDPTGAYVQPVTVRRSGRRVLFVQRSGQMR